MDEDQLSDADLWESKVDGGMSESQATAYVQRRRLQSAVRPRSLADRLKAGTAPGQGFGRQLSQMTTLGLGDEIAGFVGGVAGMVRGKPFGESYRLAKGEDQAKMQQYADDHPGRNLAAMAIGGAAAIPAGVAGRIPTIGRVMREGAAVGAAYGAGDAEGGLANRAVGALGGAAVGATGGAILHGAGRMVGAVNRMPVGARTTGGAAVGAGIGAVSDPENAEEGALRGAMIGATAVNAPALLREGSRIARTPSGVASRLAADESGGVPFADLVNALRNVPARLAPDAREAGRTRIIQALDDGPRSAADVLAEMQQRQTAKPFALADENHTLGDLTRATRAVSPQGRETIPATLETRMLSQGDRLRDDLLETTGVAGRMNPRATVEELNQAQEELVSPLYERAFSTYGVVDDPRVLEGFETLARLVPGARARTERAMAAEMARTGRPRSEYFRQVERPTQTEWNGEMLDDVEVVEVPTLRYLNLFKRDIDEYLPAARRNPDAATYLTDSVDRDIRGLKNEWLDQVDTATGGGDPEASLYRQARREWGGYGAGKNAVALGQKFTTMSEDEIAGELARMGSAERDLWRKSAIDDLLGYSDDVGGRFDLTKRKPLDLSVPNTQRKLRMLFAEGDGGESGWKALQERISEEVRMAATNPHVLGGSQTAEKLVQIAELFDVDPTALLTGDVKGVAVNWIRQLGGAARDRIKAGSTRATADAMSESLLAGAKNPNDRKAELEALQETLRRLQEQGKRRQPVRNAAAATAASRDNY